MKIISIKEGEKYICTRDFIGTGSKENPEWKKGHIYESHMKDCLTPERGGNSVACCMGEYFRLATEDEISGKVKLEDEPLTYERLMKDAEDVYRRVAQNSPFCAQFEARKYIASKIDQCVDRSEHLDVLEWEEYKKDYAPIKREEYERRLKLAKENYESTIARIEKEYQERGKFSPDYHKI